VNVVRALRSGWQLRSKTAWAIVALTWVVALSVAATVEQRLREGVSATWHAKVEGDFREVARTVETRPSFPNEHRALSRVVQGWQFERDGIPEELFEFRGTFDARLHLDRPGYPRLRATGQHTLEVDGEEVSAPLPAGTHRVVATWTSDARRSAHHFRWELCDSGDACEEMPAGALVPLHRHPLRTPVWLLAILLALGLSLFALRVGHHAAGRERMAVALGLLALLGVHLGLRLYDYDVMPEFRENGDELFATWNGWQLVEDGSTVGWSLWPNIYGDRVEHERLEYFGFDWNLVRPYFEHPPLLHVGVGIAAHLGGAEHFAHSKLRHTRLVPIGLSVISLLLLFSLGRRLGGHTRWFACLLFATLPLIAIQNRVIKEEAMIVPLALGSVWLFLRWKDTRLRRWLVLAAICAGACTLAKVTGFAFVLGLFALVLGERRWKDAALALGVGVATSALLFVYGAALNWDVFVYASENQGKRPTHFNLFVRWLHHGLINHNVVGRGWVLFLWIAGAGALARRSLDESRWIVLPMIAYWSAITIGAGNWTFGWYQMPIYAFLCLAAGRYLSDLWEKPDLLGGALLGLVLLFYTLNFVLDIEWARLAISWPTLRPIVTVAIALTLAPWAAAHVWPTRPWQNLARATMVLTLTLQVAASAYFVTRYESVAETHEHFDHDRYYDR